MRDRSAVQSRFGDESVDYADDYIEEYGLATLGIGAFTPNLEGYELLLIASACSASISSRTFWLR